MGKAEQQRTGARPVITPSFSDYEPPRNLVPMMQRALDSVKLEYLAGLTEVVLTNSGALRRDRRRSVTKWRGRKVRVSQALGLYHPATKNKGAWIEIFVDNTLNSLRMRGFSWMAWLRETELTDVLFHEVGHHIHFTIRPEFREREDVADVWKVRLRKNYQKQRRTWLAFLFRMLGLRGIVRRMGRTATAKLYANGFMSRAEYEEELGDGRRE